MSNNSGGVCRSVLELQNNIIEGQRDIIGELVKLYCTEPVFDLPEELQSRIREVNEMYRELNTP
ncbi:hypothetical protein IMSAGC019_02007 [Lachnospiraceae bacterium]|nr:hypothetical protein IMSAGC019_02007 [Lachnospiraceae bacterium]